MDTVVIYPGRFHPFHKGHKSVYDTLVKRFGKNRVFIATSDKVDPPKSPFTFEEKRAMIALTGVDPSRVIKTKSPYQATEITDNYDPQNTIALFAVSDKDMAEDPRFSFKPKKDGSPSYYQPAQKDMKSLDTHGYIITVPTLQFNVLGKPMRSASEFRANFAKADSETQKKMITDLFGKYDSNVDRIMSAKIIERLIRADEILEQLIEMGADDKYIVEACARVEMLIESIVKEDESPRKFNFFPRKRPQGSRLINPIKKLPNLRTMNKPTKFDMRKSYATMPEGKKNCGCGKTPCETFGRQDEEITKYNESDPMNSIINIKGIGTMSISSALDTISEMSMQMAKLAKEKDAKFIQDNFDRYMSLLTTYNGSVQEAYKELAQQRKRGGTKSRGIDKDITEDKKYHYYNLDRGVYRLQKDNNGKIIGKKHDRQKEIKAGFPNADEVLSNTKEAADKVAKLNEQVKLGKNITEAKDVSYDNWDHPEPVEYSKFLEKHFGDPDEMTNEQTVWHNIDGFKRVVCRDEYILHGSPAPHYDFVYSYIDLEIDEDLSDELAKCSGSILIDHLKNEVGARCGSLTANAVTLNFCLDVTAGRTEPTKDEYERRILEMKDMFANGKKWTVDWWPDESGDADPDNPFYAESVNEIFDPKHGHDSDSHVVKHKDDNDQIFYGVYNADGMITHVFYDEKKAKDFAANNHDDLMNNRITPAGEMPEELPTGEKIKPGSKNKKAKSVKAENMLGKVIDKFKTDFKKRDTLFAKGGVKTKPKVTPKQKPIPKVKQ